MHKNLGRSKSRAFNQNIEPNLVEIPIVIEGEEDGSFDPNDKIIFFGHGSSGYDISNDNLIGNKIYTLIKIHVGFSYQMIMVGEEKELQIQFNQMKEHLLITE